jgi:hypothetical protein
MSNLTFNRKNVQETVRNVADVDLRGTRLGLPESKVLEIMKLFPSDVQEQVNSYIDYFIDHDPLASWRRFIFALDVIKQKEAADSIRHLAEPITDPTLNIENMRKVVASVKDWYDLGHYAYGLCVPPAVLDEIRDNPDYLTEEDKKEVFIHYYLENVAMASWQNVAGALHYMEEKEALQGVKDFLVVSTEPTLTPKNLSTVLDIMEDDRWEKFSEYVNIPESEKDRIKSSCSSDRDCKQELIHSFVSSHPAPSWLMVARALYETGVWTDNDSCLRALEQLQQLFPTGTVK